MNTHIRHGFQLTNMQATVTRCKQTETHQGSQQFIKKKLNKKMSNNFNTIPSTNNMDPAANGDTLSRLSGLGDQLKNITLTALFGVETAIKLLDSASCSLTARMVQMIKNEMLYSLIKKNKLNQAKYLLNNGATFEGYEFVLREAANEWPTKTLMFLVENNAPKPKDQCDCTILHAATRSNDFEKVKYLLEHGFGGYIDRTNEYGNTPLNTCLMKNGEHADRRVIKLLVKEGANIDIRNADGERPRALIDKYFGREFLLSLQVIILERDIKTSRYFNTRLHKEMECDRNHYNDMLYAADAKNMVLEAENFELTSKLAEANAMIEELNNIILSKK